MSRAITFCFLLFSLACLSTTVLAQTTFNRDVSTLSVLVRDAYTGKAIAGAPILVGGDTTPYSTDHNGFVTILKTYSTADGYVRVVTAPKGYVKGFGEREILGGDVTMQILVVPEGFFQTPMIDADIGGTFVFNATNLPTGTTASYMGLPGDFKFTIKIDPGDLSSDAFITLTPYPLWASDYNGLSEPTLATVKLKATNSKGADVDLLSTITLTMPAWNYGSLDLGNFTTDPLGNEPWSCWQFDSVSQEFGEQGAGTSVTYDAVTSNFTTEFSNIEEPIAIYADRKAIPELAWAYLSTTAFPWVLTGFWPDWLLPKSPKRTPKVAPGGTTPPPAGSPSGTPPTPINWGVSSTPECGLTATSDFSCGTYEDTASVSVGSNDTITLSASWLSGVNAEAGADIGNALLGKISAKAGIKHEIGVDGSITFGVSGSATLGSSSGKHLPNYKCLSGSVKYSQIKTTYTVVLAGLPTGHIFTVLTGVTKTRNYQRDDGCCEVPTGPKEVVDKNDPCPGQGGM